MKTIVIFMGLSLCGVAFGYDSSRSSTSSRWTSRYRPTSEYALSRMRDYNVHVSEAIRKPKRFDTFIPTLNNPPSSGPRSRREYSFTTSGGLRKPSRNSFAVNIESTKAEKHYLEMREKTACRLPRERVICVQDQYPDADILYRPACTILHRCDHHSGCCAPPQKCQPASSEMVTLLFKSSDVDAKVMKLDFTNHTSCHCAMPEDVVESVTVSNEDRGREIEDELEEAFAEIDNDLDCLPCPKPFNERKDRGFCQCDCFDGDSECKLIKIGEAKISEENRRCILRHSCGKPTCALGYYFDTGLGHCRKPKYERLRVEAEVEATGATEAAEVATVGDNGNTSAEEMSLDDEVAASHRRLHRQRHHKHV